MQEEELANRYADHVKPINELIDQINSSEPSRWMPYVSPDFGGVRAQLLLLLKIPSPATDNREGQHGSGLLSVNNSDGAAARTHQLLEETGLRLDQILTWNAYPWIPPAVGLKNDDLHRGAKVLRRLVDLLPHLRVAILAGADAKTVWGRLAPPPRGVRVIPTRSTGNRAFTGAEADKAAWMREQDDVFRRAGQIIGP
jgi:hypothetical protein